MSYSETWTVGGIAGQQALEAEVTERQTLIRQFSGGVLAGYLYARRKGLPFLRLADLAAPSIALGQAIGRWGNFVNQEAYGAVATQPWQQRFPISVFIRADGQWHFATFFYESAWCFLIVAALLAADGKKLFRRDGDGFLAYVFLYALERALVEGLRTDSLYWGPFRVSQVLAAVSCVAAVSVLLYQSFRTHDPKNLLVNQVAEKETVKVESAEAETVEEESVEEVTVEAAEEE